MEGSCGGNAVDAWPCACMMQYERSVPKEVAIDEGRGWEDAGAWSSRGLGGGGDAVDDDQEGAAER